MVFICLIGTGGDDLKHDAIEELFVTHYNDALLYTISLTKNAPLAEDIVSDAFYTALRTADDTVYHFKTWLLKVCRNLYLNRLRKNRRLEPLDESLADRSESVLEQIIPNAIPSVQRRSRFIALSVSLRSREESKKLDIFML